MTNIQRGFRFTDKLYTFSQKFIQVLSLILTVLFLLGGMLFTCYSTDMTTQLVLTRRDNLLWNLLWIAAFILILKLTAGLICKNSTNPGKSLNANTVLTGIVLLWAAR